MKYILDFDRTLFDTERLYAAFANDGVDRNILVPDIWQSYQAKDFLYDDALEFLQSHTPDDLIILTAYGTKYGDQVKQYQQAKVAQEPVLSLVKQIYYVESDKVAQMQVIRAQFDLAEQLVFADDLLDHCVAVQSCIPNCTSLWVRRTDDQPAPPTDIKAISSLSELDAMI